jgi:hypothetical protein
LYFHTRHAASERSEEECDRLVLCHSLILG